MPRRADDMGLSRAQEPKPIKAPKVEVGIIDGTAVLQVTGGAQSFSLVLTPEGADSTADMLKKAAAMIRENRERKTKP